MKKSAAFKPGNAKIRTLIFLRVLVSGFLFFLLLAPQAHRIAPVFPVVENIAAIGQIFRDAVGFFFFLAFGAFILAFLLIVSRWKIIINSPEISYRALLRLTMVGFFFNNFLPTGAGGDLVKGYYLLRGRSNKLDLGLTVFVDRMVGALTISSIGLAAVIVRYADLPPAFSWSIIVLFSALSSLLLLGRRPQTEKLLARLLFFPRGRKIVGSLVSASRAFAACVTRRAVFSRSLLVSYASQSLVLVSHYLVIRSFGVFIDPSMLLVAIPLVWCATALPSLGGLGIRETAYVFFLQEALSGRETAFALALVFLGFNLLLGFSGGLVYLCGGHRLEGENAGAGDGQ